MSLLSVFHKQVFVEHDSNTRFFTSALSPWAQQWSFWLHVSLPRGAPARWLVALRAS
jgi:hypothetical protein